MLAAASISISGLSKLLRTRNMGTSSCPLTLLDRSRNEAGGSLTQINKQLTAFFITASPLADAGPGFGVFHVAQACGNLWQSSLEFTRIDSVRLHDGFDNRICQHGLQVQFATVQGHAVLVSQSRLTMFAFGRKLTFNAA
jgi:hypothetical protein